VTRLLPRLGFVVSLAAATIIVIVGGTAAGAATAASPIPDITAVQREATASDPLAQSSPDRPAPQRHVAIGRVIAVRGQRLAVATRNQRLIVGIRPRTAVWINRRPATVEDALPGDVVTVVGVPGPRGALIARAVRILRPAP